MRPQIRYTLEVTGLTLCTLAVSSFTSSGCSSGSGGFQFVKGVQVKTYQVDQDSYGEIDAVLNTGNIQLPAFELPLFNPKNPGQVYGKLTMKSAISGGSELDVAVDITQAAGLPGVPAKLPNGSDIPVGGLGNEVIAFPAGNTQAIVYAAFSDKVAMIGSAIPIKEFDQIGNLIGGANLFPSFTFPQGIRGIAGVFTGSGAGQNGLALFVDASSLLAPVVSQNLKSGLVSIASQTQPKLQQLVFWNVKPSSSKENTINQQLFNLHQKRAKVHLK